MVRSSVRPNGFVRSVTLRFPLKEVENPDEESSGGSESSSTDSGAESVNGNKVMLFGHAPSTFSALKSEIETVT